MVTERPSVNWSAGYTIIRAVTQLPPQQGIARCGAGGLQEVAYTPGPGRVMKVQVTPFCYTACGCGGPCPVIWGPLRKKTYAEKSSG